MVDNKAPVVKSLTRKDSAEKLKSLQDSGGVNVVSKNKFEFLVEAEDLDSPIDTFYQLSDLIDEAGRLLSIGNGESVPQTGAAVTLAENKTQYIGVFVKDKAGNSSGIQYYPLV